MLPQLDVIKRYNIYKLLYCLQKLQSNCQSIFTENIKDTYITFTKHCKVYDKIEWTLLSALKDMDILQHI